MVSDRTLAANAPDQNPRTILKVKTLTMVDFGIDFGVDFGVDLGADFGADPGPDWRRVAAYWSRLAPFARL